MMQVIFGAFRLLKIYMKAVNCDGIPNAYFFHGDRPTIRICYEYLRSIYDMMPKEPTAEGSRRARRSSGSCCCHRPRVRHAVFDIYNLRCSYARKARPTSSPRISSCISAALAHLIWGPLFVQRLRRRTSKTSPGNAADRGFASDHGARATVLQSGPSPTGMIEDLRRGGRRSYLPDPRAKVCKYEYSNQATDPARRPHIDQDKAEKAYETTGTVHGAVLAEPARPPQALQDHRLSRRGRRRHPDRHSVPASATSASAAVGGCFLIGRVRRTPQDAILPGIVLGRRVLAQQPDPSDRSSRWAGGLSLMTAVPPETIPRVKGDLLRPMSAHVTISASSIRLPDGSRRQLAADGVEFERLGHDLDIAGSKVGDGLLDIWHVDTEMVIAGVAETIAKVSIPGGVNR